MYINSIPNWIQSFFKDYTWKIPPNDFQPSVYLTFDDGPHNEITYWILDQLELYDAKATFFCIGKNVIENPNAFSAILDKGHNVGNHTHTHLNGRKTKNETYINDIIQAEKFIESKLFRPPYGSIKRSQVKVLKSKGYKIILWTIIPGDWDKNVSPEACLENIVFKLKPGDIIVLHDSDKAKTNMQFVLPRLLEFCKNKNWRVSYIPM